MKILLIRLSSLGDIVLTQSVAAALRKKYPNAEIHFITKKAFVPIVEAFGCIDQIHVWGEYKSFSKLRKLAKNRFDLVIDLHNKFNTFLIKKIVNGKNTATYNKHHHLRWKIVQHQTNQSISSTVELYFSALKKAGIEAEISNPELYPKNELNEKLADLFETNKHNVAIFPGALHKTKQYPTEQLAEMINSLDEKFNIFLLGSAAEKNLISDLRKLLNRPIINFVGKLNIAELISFMQKADAVISNDSGPMHIAAALQKPQIAIFGATNPRLGFAPLNKKAIVLIADLACQPCSLHGGKNCPLTHFNCMQSISPQKIKTELLRILSEKK
ncbi:MAG: lipopolysaccharide heptosyltransferase II [Candidatus Cloacimonadales bacterium]|nr:lipopolysaccharide heptosyltransferase II [Candidatus Cloacimonadales bacterium]